MSNGGKLGYSYNILIHLVFNMYSSHNSSNDNLISKSYQIYTVTPIKRKIPIVSMSNVSLAQNVIKLLCGHNKTSFKKFLLSCAFDDIPGM